MKTKKFFIYAMLVLIATFYLLPAFAQDLFLPEGARARLGLTFRCPHLQGRVDEGESDGHIVNYLWDFDYFPDSRRLILITSSGVGIYNADTAQKLPHIPWWDFWDARRVVITSDGETIALGNLSGAIYHIKYDMATDQKTLVHTSGGWGTPPTYVPIAWIQPAAEYVATVVEKWNESGSLSSVIYGSNRKGIFRQMAQVHEHEQKNRRTVPRVMNLGFHGSRMASASTDGIIYRYNLLGPYDLPGRPSYRQRFVEYQEVSGDERVEATGHYYRTHNSNPNFPDPVPRIEVVVTLRDNFKYPHGLPDDYALRLDHWEHPANTMSLYEDISYDGITADELKYTFIGHTGCIWNVAYSEDGDWVGSASVDGTIRVWNPREGHEVDQFNSHILRLSNLAFSPDGKRMAVGQWDGTIIISPSDSRIGQLKLKGHTGPVTSVAFHPNLPILATASTDGTLQVWSLQTDTPAEIKHGFSSDDLPRTSVAFSPDGRKLAVGRWANSVSLNSIDVLEWDGGHRVGEPLGVVYEDETWLQLDRHWEAVTSVAFSPDGELLAAGGVDGAVQLWAINSGGDIQSIPRVLPRHQDSVFKVVFSSDSKTLASGSDDGTVLLWDLERVAPFDSTDPPKPEDMNGNGDEPSPQPEDANADGEVNILDLVLVSANFGQTGKNIADVNQNGVVDIQDLVLVAIVIGDAAAAPSTWNRDLEFPLIRMEVAQWLAQAQQLNRTESTSQRGIRFLEALLASLTPQETALLANYPNPFNPETWIPYQLAVPADVTIRIYAMDGNLIRTLVLGYQAAGIYQSRSLAAYWDGKNEVGEPVASGTYFYTLTAGEFSSTRKLLIRK